MLQKNEELTLSDPIDSESTRTDTESSTDLDSSVSLTDIVLAPQRGAIRSECVQDDDKQQDEPKQLRRASLTEMFSRSFRRKKEKSKRKERRVSFGAVQRSPKTYELSSRDKEKMWYNKDELGKMRDRLIQMVQEDESIDCLRGLEAYFEDDQQVKTEETNFIMLEHLHSMSYSEVDDSFDINSIAASLTKETVKAGEMKAAEDSAEAYMVYLETFEPAAVNRFFQQRITASHNAKRQSRIPFLTN